MAPRFQLLLDDANPFNPLTIIENEIPGPAEISLRIYDLHGAPVTELPHERSG